MSKIHKGIIKDWSNNQISHRQCVSNFLKGVNADTRLQARINMCLAAKACKQGIDDFDEIYQQEYDRCKVKILKKASENEEF